MFKVLNEHYIQNEESGEHLNLNDVCDLLNQLSKENRELNQDLVCITNSLQNALNMHGRI